MDGTVDKVEGIFVSEVGLPVASYHSFVSGKELSYEQTVSKHEDIFYITLKNINYLKLINTHLQQTMIGLIIPPAEIKKLLQKTAEHVATNGSEFEKILIQRQQNKPEFAFLRIDSPYRPYYDHRVAEFSKQLLQGNIPQQSKQQIKQEEPIKKEEPTQQETLLQKIFVELKEPDPQKYIAEIPQKLTEGEQAIIQHTAQYAAKNGKNFLVALSERQKNNPQFQFLRIASKNHGYFIKMVEAYTNVIEMTEEDHQRLKKYSTSREEILQKCRGIFEYHMAKQQQARGKKDQTKQVKESNVDWNDFELVQTISFDYDQNKNIVGGQLLARIQQNAALVPKNLQQKIISQPKSKQILQKCHVCGQNILASEMNKHLKTCLGQKKKNTPTESFQGNQVDIRKNLQDLSVRRPDIFGSQDNQISARDDNKSKEDKVYFDGQSTTMNRSTGSQAMLMYQQNKLKEQMEKNKK